jgi:hypothetical protein
MKISTTDKRILPTTVNRKDCKFEQSDILKNVGILKCTNIGMLGKLKRFHNIRLNIKSNKQIINGLTNHLYNHLNKCSDE